MCIRDRYTSGEVGYLNFDGIPAQGIAIKKNGHVGFGYNPNIYASLNHFITVHIHPSNPAAAFVTYVNFPFDYGDVISVVARRKTDMAYVVRSGTTGNNEIVYYKRFPSLLKTIFRHFQLLKSNYCNKNGQEPSQFLAHSLSSYAILHIHLLNLCNNTYIFHDYFSVFNFSKYTK